MHCKICGYRSPIYDKLSVEERLADLKRHIYEMAKEVSGPSLTKKEQELRNKHKEALENCICIMELIEKDEEKSLGWKD